MVQTGVDKLEDLHDARLSEADRKELLTVQSECTVIFAGANGWPGGVIMSFVAVDGKLWLTAVDGRVQTRAAEADSRVSIVVSSAGTALKGRRMIAFRGHVRLHRDAEAKKFFFPRFAAELAPGDPEAFIKLLDSPKRVIFEFEPVAITASHDSRKLAGDGRGGPPKA